MKPRLSLLPVLAMAAAALVGLSACRDLALRQIVEDLVTEYKLGYLPGWSQPVLLESQSGYARAPRVAIGSGDKGYVVWEHYRSTPSSSWSVYASRYDGSTWTDEQLFVESSFGAGMPEVSVGADGYAFVIYGVQEGSEFRAYVRRFAGGSWSTGGYLDTSGDALSLSEPLNIGLDADGKAIAAWVQTNGSTISDLKVRKHDGTAWDAEQPLESPDGIAANGHLAMAADGTAMIVWEQRDGADYNIYADSYTGSDWSGAVEIDGSTVSCVDPIVAAGNAGIAAAAWVKQDTTEQVCASLFNGTSWATPTPLGIYSGGMYTHAVAVSDAGAALVLWIQDDGGTRNLYSCYFNGTSWGSPTLVEHSDALISIAHQAVRVAFCPNGTAIAVWVQDDPNGDEAVFFNHFNGSSWGQEDRFPRTGSFAAYPNLDISPEGHALVAWYERIGASEESVYASIYRP